LHLNPEVEKANTTVGFGLGVLSQWRIRYEFSPKFFTNYSYVYEIEESKVDNTFSQSKYMLKNSSLSVEMGFLF